MYNKDMEEMVAKMSGKHEDDEAALPGFRFHPTDEELVGFYLRRKVEKKLINIEIIKQVDIYKYDPWDLPKVSTLGDKEWYFFCMRGRKYRNSIRPNRVTGSGFWKATGIDKPIYSTTGRPGDCIGLKKSLVYYRGSAGKGTKTDWMMHEFRLPPNGKSNSQEAEVWTLCRIFKRAPSHKNYTPNQWMVQKETNPIAARQPNLTDSCSKTCSLESDQTSDHDHHRMGLQDFPVSEQLDGMKKRSSDARNHPVFNPATPIVPPSSSTYSSVWNINGGDFVVDGGGWDELRSVVEGYTEQ